ncbi:MAG: hypothetical protein GY707_15650, partial [Desulfobacteraceae bacterium]|nr:hypothetical protein [Desulfobacteraceae bacterium]
TSARGCAILCPSNLSNFEFIDKWNDNEGRICVLNMKVNNELHCLINIYAPTKNNHKGQLDLLDNLEEVIHKNENASLIIGGDFNTYLDPILDKDGGSFEPLSKYSHKLQKLMEDFQLCDIWRCMHPINRRYTWRQNRPLIQSRLDYFIISQNLSQNTKKCDIKPSIKTDHSLLTLSITHVLGEKRGPNFWKFNNALLKDDVYIDYIKEIIIQLQNDYLHIENKGLKWDLIKSEIRQRTITYAKTQNRLKRCYENDLKSKYNELSDKYSDNKNSETLSELENIKKEIENINSSKVEGARIRTKGITLSSKQDASYYTKKEIRNYKNSHITVLEKANGEEITVPSNIRNEIKSFYQNLYSIEEVTNTNDDYFFNRSPKISKSNIDLSEKEITIEECEKALQKMKNGKTPGSDGFTADFYKLFWNVIKDLVFESFGYAFDIGELSIDQKRGIIKLLPKKDKVLKFLKNWRPISLLNTDYKIIAHVMASRLQQILPTLIHPDQNGYIQGRFIGCSIRTIYDIIENSQNEEYSNLITFIDYEKAFDNINWNFMIKALKSFGFGNNFIKWIKVMYKNASSCIMNNGYSSEFFNLSKGVRQGCPLSALLFVIVVETLSNAIRSDRDIHGIIFNQHEVKISLLADDTTLFLKDPNSLSKALDVICMFSQSSGLKINNSKSQVIQVGKRDWNISKFNLKSVKERVYTLGTWFYKDPLLTNRSNYDDKFNEMEKVLNSWKNKNISVLERIKIVKVFALPKLTYIMSSLEISDTFVEKVQNSINCFIWNNKPPKIKQTVSYQKYEHGGLKIPNVELFVKANRANWMKRLLHHDNRNGQYVKMFIPDKDLHKFIKCNFNPKDLNRKIPLFYWQVLFAWFELKRKPTSSLQVIRECLFYNQHIRINGQYVKFPKTNRKDLTVIGDVVNENGTFLDYREICNKFGKILTHFQYMSLIDAIPKEWRKMLKNHTLSHEVRNKDEPPYYCNGKCEIPLLKLTSNRIYWDKIDSNLQNPTCITSWSKRINVATDKQFWKHAFTLPHMCLNDHIVVSFQIKILHRYYPCQKLIAKWDKNITGLCELCKKDESDIVHTFYGCEYSIKFWKSIQNILCTNHDFAIDLTKEIVLFGYTPYTIRLHSINHLIFYGKYYMHLEICNKKIPQVYQFVKFYKHVLDTEKEYYVARNNRHLYNILYSKVCNSLLAFSDKPN